MERQRGAHDRGREEEDEEPEDDMAELRERRKLFGPRILFGSGIAFALAVMLLGSPTRGLVLAAVMLALAYFRVLPVTLARAD